MATQSEQAAESPQSCQGPAPHAGAASAERDISARKREEENLRRFATVVRDSNDAITIQDFEGQITAWNRGAELMYGYSEAEALLINIERLTAPGKVEEQKAFIRRLIAGKAITSFETQRVTKDGRVLDVWMTVTKLVDDAGNPIGIASTERDITSRKRKEENLRRFATVVRDSNDAITIQDFEGQITAWNRGAELMYGYGEAEALLTNIERLTAPGKVEEQKAFIRRLIAGEAITSFETQRVTKDGRVLDVWMTVTKLVDDAGKPIGVASTERDITARKREEEAKVKLESQFHQAQKMEAVGCLAGGVAHDFNNLLMGIMGYAELCRDHIEPGHPIREWLDEITNDAERSAAITRQLLAFARKQIIAPKVLDLNDAVEGMLKLLRRLIGEDINLAWLPGASLPPIRIDPSQIDQILANLCVNARDAIAGVGKITLTTELVSIDAGYCAWHIEAQPGTYVVLTVSDSGCGMDAETLAQVFEPFFTTKGLGKGTGLGLATVYGIVKQNNGCIYAYSEPGKGTTFKIYLPQHVTEAVAKTVRRKTEAPKGHGETILLVEDEKSLRVTCNLFLAALGYHVLVAETPGQALKLCDGHPCDIHMLLTDVVMPGMDGLQLATRIRAVKPSVKVLFMSGYTADVIAQRGVLEEKTEFIGKPFTRDDLARKVHDIMETRDVGG